MIDRQTIRKFALCTLGATFLTSEVLQADAYEAGTTSFKPINMNLAAFSFGKRKTDSRLTAVGFDGFVTNSYYPVRAGLDAYRSPLSFGFHEADRNGYGYGAEFGYVIGWDTELYGRAGFSHERPMGDPVLIGDRTLRFDSRNNWSMLFGARRYFDCQSVWKPFLSAGAGFTVQDSTKALVSRQNPFSFTQATNLPIAKYKLLKRKTLLNLEFGGGTDYTFSEHWALTLAVNVRYGERAGSGTIDTPGLANWPFPPGFSPANAVTFQDRRPRWTVPVTLSLKTTNVIEGLSKLAQGLPGMPSKKKQPDFVKNGNGQTWTGDIKSDVKYTTYRESGPRYKIDVWQGMAVVPVNDFEFTVDIQRDAQSGASNAGPLSAALLDFSRPVSQLSPFRTGATISDDRNEVSFKTTYNLKDSKYDVTLYYSTEDDFVSRGLSTGGTWYFNKNNTALDASVGISGQTLRPADNGNLLVRYIQRESGKNTSQKYYISLKQDLSKYNYIQFSNEFNYQHGLLVDPYKAALFYGDSESLVSPGRALYVLQGLEALYPAGVTLSREKRPRSRSIWMPMIRFVQYVPWTDGSAHFDYRFGADTWGIRSHMFQLTYYQPFMERWELVPLIRYYSQNAAKFYAPTFTVANIPSPFPAAPLRHRTFSTDSRLARFGSMSYEIKLTYKVFDQMKLGFTAGYYARKPGYSMAKKDRISNPEYNGSPIGAKYFGVDMNFKF